MKTTNLTRRGRHVPWSAALVLALCAFAPLAEADEGGLLCPQPGQNYCSLCEGGVTELTMAFADNDSPLVTIVQENGDVVLHVVPDPFQPFSVSGSNVNGTFGKYIDIFENGRLAATIPTDCSEPIFTGMTFDEFWLLVGKSLYGGSLCPEYPHAQCVECVDGVRSLTLVYRGERAVPVMVWEKGAEGVSIFADLVMPEEVFTINGKRKDGLLGEEIVFNVNGVLSTFHTSCSEPIGPGVVSGDFEIVSGESGKLAPEPDDADEDSDNGECGACDGKVTELSLKYNGSVSAQVKVEDKKGGLIFSKAVNPGETFSFSGKDDNGTLGTEITLRLDGAFSTAIHTSCSKPIGPGMVFGPFEIVAGASLEGGRLCPQDDPDNGGGEDPNNGSDDEECGECDGKVTELSLVYLGGIPALVTVEQKKGGVIFNGTVEPNESFSFKGTDKDGTMGTEINVYLNEEFHIAIHTSCSKPIDAGMVFGDFRIEAGKSRLGGPFCPPEVIDECPSNPARDKKGPCNDCWATEEEEADDDGDGVPNCLDGCKNDFERDEPWLAQCGEDASDVDGDCTPAGLDWDDGNPNAFDEEPQCDTLPLGAECDDGICQGIHTCNAEGECGNPDECNPGMTGNGCNEPCVQRRFKDRWYWFCPCAKSWEQAAAICREVPSRSLVEVSSQRENEYLACNVQKLFGTDTWLGGNDLKKEGKWFWASYLTNSRDSFWKGDENGTAYWYESWKDGEPSGGEEQNCAAMMGDGIGEWKDGECEKKMPFICEETTERVYGIDIPIFTFPESDSEDGWGSDNDTPCVDPEEIGFTEENVGKWEGEDGAGKKADQCRVDQEEGHCKPEGDGWSAGCEDNCTGIVTPPASPDSDPYVQEGAACEEDEWENEDNEDNIFCRVEVRPYQIAAEISDYRELPFCIDHSECRKPDTEKTKYRCGWMSKCSAVNNPDFDPGIRPDEEGYQPRLIECEGAACYDCKLDRPGDNTYCAELMNNEESKCELVRYGMCTNCAETAENIEECACLGLEKGECAKYGKDSTCEMTPRAERDKYGHVIRDANGNAKMIGPRIGVCGRIDEQCPLYEQYPDRDKANYRCASYNLCTPEEPEAEEAVMNTEALTKSALEDSVFGKPTKPADVERYPEKEWVEFTTEPKGVKHPWCQYKVEDSVGYKDTNDAENGADLKNGEAKKPGNGKKDPVSFEFHPTLVLEYDLGEGPLGIIEPSLVAEAGVNAQVVLTDLMEVITADVDIVDVLFSLKLGLLIDDEDDDTDNGVKEVCGLDTTDSRIEIFGIDFLPGDLRLEEPNGELQAKCIKAYGELKAIVKKVKKGYMDAQALVEFFKTGNIEGILDNLPTEYLNEVGAPVEELLALVPEEIRDTVRTYVTNIAEFKSGLQNLTNLAQNGDIEQFLASLPDHPDNIKDYFNQLRVPLQPLLNLPADSGLPNVFQQAIATIQGELGDVETELESVKTALALVEDKRIAVQNAIDGAEKELKNAEKELKEAKKNLEGLLGKLNGSIRDAASNYQGYITGVLNSVTGLEELPAGFLSEKLAAIAPTDFPASDCLGDVLESPKDTINRFVKYYNGVLHKMLKDKMSELTKAIPRLPGEDSELLDKLSTSWGKNEEITLFTQTFMIGPIPCNLEVLFTFAYGVDIKFEPSLALGELLATIVLPDDTNSDPFAYARFNAKPYAGAGVGLFVGVGFDIGVVAAKAGIEGSINLAKLGLNLYGGAGVSLNTKEDPRELSTYLEEYTIPREEEEALAFPRRFNFRLNYDYGMNLTIDDMLAAKLAVKLKLKFLFFSKTWRKTLASWDGLCPAGGIKYEDRVDGVDYSDKKTRFEWCDITLFSGSGSVDIVDYAVGQGKPDWGMMQMPMPFLKLKPLDDEEGDIVPSCALGPVVGEEQSLSGAMVPLARERKGGGDGGEDENGDIAVTADSETVYRLLMGQMEEPFYDNLCTCIASKESYLEQGVEEKDIPRCATNEQCCEGLVCLIEEQGDEGPRVYSYDVNSGTDNSDKKTGFCVVEQIGPI